MIFLLTISKINTPDKDTIDRLVRVHTAPNISVVKKYVDSEIPPDGYTIEKKDDLLSNIIKHDDDLKNSIDLKHIQVVAEEKAILKRQAKFAKDTSVTEGVKPYEPTRPKTV
jgi:hypothetical protein